MGNLKTAALACGVVASILCGGFGVAYITSSTVNTADLVTDENEGVIDIQSVISSTAENIREAEKATTYKGTTTKKSHTAEITTAASKKSRGAQEGTTSQHSTEAATEAARISRSVPAPVPAPAAITQPVTQEPTTVATDAIASSAAETTVTTVGEAASTTATTATTASTTINAAETTAIATTAVSVTEPAETTTTIVVTQEVPAVTTDVDANENTLPISDEEYVLLCNAVAHEAGCSWIGVYDKANVVEVIMNRVNSSLYPDTIYGVLTQPRQFSGASGYVNLGTYSAAVTQSVKDAVTLYFTETDSFTQGYFFFYGDGYRNYFY